MVVVWRREYQIINIQLAVKKKKWELNILKQWRKGFIICLRHQRLRGKRAERGRCRHIWLKLNVLTWRAKTRRQIGVVNRRSHVGSSGRWSIRSCSRWSTAGGSDSALMVWICCWGATGSGHGAKSKSSWAARLNTEHVFSSNTHTHVCVVSEVPKQTNRQTVHLKLWNSDSCLQSRKQLTDSLKINRNWGIIKERANRRLPALMAVFSIVEERTACKLNFTEICDWLHFYVATLTGGGKETIRKETNELDRKDISKQKPNQCFSSLVLWWVGPQ